MWRIGLLVVPVLAALLWSSSANAFPEVQCTPGVKRVQDVKGQCGSTLVGYVPPGTTIQIQHVSTSGVTVLFETKASYIYGLTNLDFVPTGRICFSGPGFGATRIFALDGLPGTPTVTECRSLSLPPGDSLRILSVY